MLKAGCLPYAVGKQPSIPLINLGRNGHLTDDDDEVIQQIIQHFRPFFKLDKYATFSFTMTSGLASDSVKFKIIITLGRAQKMEIHGPIKISFFC